jgi:hypothetical protein
LAEPHHSEFSRSEDLFTLNFIGCHNALTTNLDFHQDHNDIGLSWEKTDLTELSFLNSRKFSFTISVALCLFFLSQIKE